MPAFTIYRYRLRSLRTNSIWLLRGIIKKHPNVTLHLGVLKIADKLNWSRIKPPIRRLAWDMTLKVVGWKPQIGVSGVSFFRVSRFCPRKHWETSNRKSSKISRSFSFLRSRRAKRKRLCISLNISSKLTSSWARENKTRVVKQKGENKNR